MSLKRTLGLKTLVKTENGRRRVIALNELYWMLIWRKFQDVAGIFKFCGSGGRK